MNNKLAHVKTGVRLAVGLSVGYVVASIIKNNTAPENGLQKVEIVIATVVLGSMVALAAENYASKQVDTFVVDWNEKVQKANQK